MVAVLAAWAAALDRAATPRGLRPARAAASPSLGYATVEGATASGSSRAAAPPADCRSRTACARRPMRARWRTPCARSRPEPARRADLRRHAALRPRDGRQPAPVRAGRPAEPDALRHPGARASSRRRRSSARSSPTWSAPAARRRARHVAGHGGARAERRRPLDRGDAARRLHRASAVRRGCSSGTATCGARPRRGNAPTDSTIQSSIALLSPGQQPTQIAASVIRSECVSGPATRCSRPWKPGWRTRLPASSRRVSIRRSSRNSGAAGAGRGRRRAASAGSRTRTGRRPGACVAATAGPPAARTPRRGTPRFRAGGGRTPRACRAA